MGLTWESDLREVEDGARDVLAGQHHLVDLDPAGDVLIGAVGDAGVLAVQLLLDDRDGSARPVDSLQTRAGHPAAGEEVPAATESASAAAEAAVSASAEAASAAVGAGVLEGRAVVASESAGSTASASAAAVGRSSSAESSSAAEK